MTVDSLDVLVSKLEELQPLVKAVNELGTDTIRSEASALIAILQRLSPIMPAIAHKIQVSYHDTGEQFSEPHQAYHDKKGVIIVDGFSRAGFDRGTRGSYSGSRLVLFDDCSLVSLERSGGWSAWQNESSSWQIEGETSLTPEEAIRRYGLSSILSGLADEFKEAAERLKGQQVDYQDRLLTVEKSRRC